MTARFWLLCVALAIMVFGAGFLVGARYEAQHRQEMDRRNAEAAHFERLTRE